MENNQDASNAEKKDLKQAMDALFDRYLEMAEWLSVGVGADKTNCAQYMLYDFARRLDYHDDKIQEPETL